MSDSKSACVTLGLAPSFGFGDRIGLATPGHVEAMKRSGAGIEPIFPQQSIREMARTRRTAEGVMKDAINGMRQAGWSGKTGADADHLKTPADVDVTAAAGFTFFTIDPSDHVDELADSYRESELRDKYNAVKDQIDWFGTYLGREFTLSTGVKVVLDEEACMRCAVKYGVALNEAIVLADHIRKVQADAGRDYEIELSVDETEQPTTLAEHYIVAEQCLQRGMKLVSLAPRFIGELEKGVDYKGDVAALESSLNDHAALARMLGPYKLSLHSGSDKISMYAALARATQGMFHVKTAGTSYLEALRVVVRHDEPLFRRIVEFGRSRYDTDKATYHVSATNATVLPGSELKDATRLEQVYLERWSDVPVGKGFTEPGRQILHCTFGSVLTHAEFGPAVRHVLETHPDTYTELLPIISAGTSMLWPRECESRSEEDEKPMLKHQLIHPTINEILGRAGHHAKVLIADGNYPASSKKGPNAQLVHLNLMPGLVTCNQVLQALLTAVPFEEINTMNYETTGPYALSEDPAVWNDYRQTLHQSHVDLELKPIEKWSFYDAVATEDHVLTIQTADQQRFANVLLTIGVRMD